MSVKCQVVMEALDQLAPRSLAEHWDNVGLLLGNPAQDVNKLLVALDITSAVVEFAIANNFDMIVAHHPLIFKPLKNIRTDLQQGKMLSSLIKNDIAVFSLHTNLDIARGGINDLLAEKFQLQAVKPLTISSVEDLTKLAVFVPQEHLEKVRTAICKAGAGQIGNYAECTFAVAGTGSFKPLDGTNPFIGNVNKLEQVAEYRLETIMPTKIVNKVLKALLKAHPYEEVAYDLYKLENTINENGLGRIGVLEKPLTMEKFLEKVKTLLKLQNVRFVGNSDKIIKKVAICSGSGAEFIVKSAYQGADVIITGDVKYHEAQQALENDINIIDAGHFGTEYHMAELVAQYLTTKADSAKWQLEKIEFDKISTDIFKFS